MITQERTQNWDEHEVVDKLRENEKFLAFTHYYDSWHHVFVSDTVVPTGWQQQTTDSHSIQFLTGAHG
jgi:hypothetical protein